MTASLEVIGVSPEQTSSISPWCRCRLAPTATFTIGGEGADLVVTGVTGAAGRDGVTGIHLEIVPSPSGWGARARSRALQLDDPAPAPPAGDRSSAQFFAKAPAARFLAADTSFALVSGAVITMRAIGLTVQFFDDDTPVFVPLTRLRQVGRAFLFAPSPPDGAERWRVLVEGTEEVLLAVRTPIPSVQRNVDAQRMLAAIPGLVEVLHTEAGAYVVLSGCAGVTLHELLARTDAQSASLDVAWAGAIVRETARQVRAFADAGWPEQAARTEDIVITWAGDVRWLGYARPSLEIERAPGSVELRESSLRVLAAELGVDGSHDGGVWSPEGARGLAGVVARLFSEERAAEWTLSEEVRLVGRDRVGEILARGRGV